jgi:hypothetical protein
MKTTKQQLKQIIKEELTDYEREQGYDPEEKTFRTGGWGHSEDPTTPSTAERLADLASRVANLVDQAEDTNNRSALIYIQKSLEDIAGNMGE